MRFPVPHLQRAVLQGIPIGVGNLHRAVGRVVGEHGQEGSRIRGTHKLDGPGGKVVGQVSLPPDELSVMLELRAEIMGPVAGGKSVKFIKPAKVRVVRGLRTVVPLAEQAGPVTRVTKDIAQGGHARIHAFSTGGSAVNP
ncbi:hypothetical protein RB2501_13179 [Robiginitalea biformata HTCC2501]|uniref:Uncharacterized protein n=1 Tax=Robiginitalea biformata (strain ATCC BAA-864 / DSM 15991 / KCTC 12146 / HTCC2501) TaxID=313596 RepID=A4CK83_ROBBH|nr:hypothetical protein RB2501_13179 [Robiginitalea biformata HTCC2501]